MKYNVKTNNRKLTKTICGQDPLKLLHRISQLESANVDMQMELEALVMQQVTCCPSRGVVLCVYGAMRVVLYVWCYSYAAVRIWCYAFLVICV
eukprot:1649579-Rhodomonas_salina.2